MVGQEFLLACGLAMLILISHTWFCIPGEWTMLNCHVLRIYEEKSEKLNAAIRVDSLD